MVFAHPARAFPPDELGAMIPARSTFLTVRNSLHLIAALCDLSPPPAHEGEQQ